MLPTINKENIQVMNRHCNTNNCACGYDGDENESQYCKKPELKLCLECGINPRDAIFEIDDDRVEENQSFVLNRLMVDTSKLSRPVVKIDFSSIIFFEAEDESGDEHEVEVDLLFKLIRVCGGCAELIEKWRYLKEFDVENSIDELEVEISESFSVSFCDTPCPGCCEYLIIVEGKDFEGEFDALRVVSPELSALVQGYI